MNRYQGDTIEDGMFSRIGTCHMHVDAGGFAAAVDIAKMLDAKHPVPCKAVPVVDLVSGPQRKQSPDAYAEHHPAHDKDPQADSFASVYLGDVARLSLVPAILNDVYFAYPHAIVELEQVSFAITWDGQPKTVQKEHDSVKLDVPGARQIVTQVSYEYHHGFNLDRSAPQPDLDQLVEHLAGRDVEFGSIYVFDRGDQLAYRTNCFTAGGVGDKLIKERQICAETVAELTGNETRVKTVLEKVLGIWQPAR
ncbi:hypothetical protein JOD64_005546 [Micromonospora luteifusca]|uniref:Uncharacterized protein n=1 Tax=Micromonospora luteifusca TaxID=709860 RepID=A0ABS2M1K3_9ACTN|nr:hypothetical protein [Micromonospora luteifusca]MBM7494324.1 hypothetical protein [Micromonospora luteifusca]